METLFKENIIELPLEKEIEKSYLNYAMSVIIGRALPDARDGLKPVQRRILYAMSELGVRHNQPFKKSARIVGETMGKFHPHGDTAIYDAMSRMAQDYNMRLPFVDGQGNFGSIDGDPPAAMRYTEARLSEAGEEMLADIDEDSVDFRPNFDESLKEPVLLPSRIPNLLVNGASGIAVGMSSNMPPHNLSEIADGCIALIDSPDIDVHGLMQYIHGPDFPTGGIIVGTEGIEEAYCTGRGKLTLRGKTVFEKTGRSRPKLVITEIPYSQNKTALIEAIAKCVQSGAVEGVTDVRDESDRSGIRIVLDLQKDADNEKILKKLWVKTPLQCSYGIINLAVLDGATKEFGLKDLLNIYIDHRRSVIKRRTEYRLKKVTSRLHIVEGLLKAQELTDKIVKMIKAAKDGSEAKASLVEKLKFSEEQAAAILDMRLQRLTGLEKSKLEADKAACEKEKASLEKILSGKKNIDAVLKAELKDLKKRYSESRKTEIMLDNVE